MKDPDDLREDDEPKQGHKNMEEIMSELDKIGSPLITLEQEGADYE